MSTARKALAAVGSFALAVALTSVLSVSGDAVAGASQAAKPTGDVSRWDGATDTTASGARCEDYKFNVSMGANQPKQYKIFGRLCHRGEINGKTLQILLHGGTYDHTYWDFPYQPDRYNYVRSATRAGYATLSLDRIGYGYSSHPNPLATSFDKHGWTVHQIVQHIRTGQLGANFHKIVLVGHSMGSFTTWEEAGIYKDVDGVIITGAEHNANSYLWTKVVPALVLPAQLDPKFADKGYPLGTLTTFPGVRCGVLYHQPNVDPKVCEVDERLKSTANVAEGASFPPAIITNSALSQAINVPVLMVDGQFDYFYCARDCNDRKAQEAESYTGSPCYESHILPATGHDVNLHRDAKKWFDIAQNWLGKRIGLSKQTPATAPCS